MTLRFSLAEVYNRSIIGCFHATPSVISGELEPGPEDRAVTPIIDACPVALLQILIVTRGVVIAQE